MDADMRNVLDQVASSTRLMAFSQRKAIEKDAGENSKLKSLETLQILHFLSTFNKKSVSPAYFQVDRDLRQTLEMALGLPDGSTLESYYGEALGPDVAFIRDLRALAGQRKDSTPKEILHLYCMKDKSTLDRTALMTMLSSCKQAFILNPDNFDEFSPGECKECVVANIYPLSFRRTIEAFNSRYMNPAYSFNALVNLIVQEFDLELSAINRLKSQGIGGFAHVAVDNDFFGLSVTNPSVDKTVGPATSTSTNMTCFNCGKKGHPAQACTIICKFHKKQCADKMVCFRENRSAKQKAAKELAKANLAVVDVKVSTAHNSNLAANNYFTVSSPRMIEVEEKIGLIDTGCNALCLTRESQFDSVIKTNNSSISVADGKSVSIQGSGLICQKPAQLVKDFKTGLIPTSAFTDNFWV